MNGFDFPSIRKDIPVPLYYQIKQAILTAIHDGRLKPGDALPTEYEFCEHFGVSRPTIRQALGELYAEGYLRRQKGKGTHVSAPKIDARFLNKLQSFNREMWQKGMQPSTSVLDLSIVSGREQVNKQLGLAPKDKLIHLERVRGADGEPVVYLDTYLPYEPFRVLMQVDFVAESLYDVLESHCHTRIERVARTIEAVEATPREASLLKTEPRSALCLVKTIGYTDRDVPVEYSIARYRGDRNQFSVELHR